MSHCLKQVTRTVMVAPVHDDAAMSGFLIGREENDPELE
jgi:hypothetical protein